MASESDKWQMTNIIVELVTRHSSLVTINDFLGGFS